MNEMSLLSTGQTTDLRYTWAEIGFAAVSMAETNCAGWRGNNVPVWLREKGNDAPSSVGFGFFAL